MQIKLNELSSSADQFRTLKTQLDDKAEILEHIISKYRDLTVFNRYVSQIYTVRNEIFEEREHCEQFRMALESIRNLCETREHRIVDKCEGVQTISIKSNVTVEDLTNVSSAVSGVMNGTGATEPFDIMEMQKASLEGMSTFKDIEKSLGIVGDFSEIYELFGGENKFIELLGEYSEEIKNLDVLKTLGYIADSFGLVDALNSGDADKVEKLLVKYGEKGIGKLLKSTIGLDGFTGAMYISIGLNAGENLVEEITEFQTDPSLGSFAGIIWGASGGAIFDTSADIAKDAMDLVFTLTGNEFDEKGFDMAMDYLSNEMEMVVEAVGDGIEDGIKYVGDTITGFADSVWDGICNAGETIASWLPW